ncbi:MAG: nitroreductase family protein [Rectinemataceae bacterium]|nr:nitroreductase family protein [Rectinemataceae bacterium]
MTMMEAMEARVSTRSFDGAGLTAPEMKDLADLLATVAQEEPPFGSKVRLALAAGEGAGSGASDGKPLKLGTYGLISGISAFIVPAVLPGPGAMEDAGYIIEKAVLEATARGWGSCWIGGVFSRSKAAAAAKVKEGELVPSVIALGKPAAKRSIADRIVAGAAKARSRKPLASLFFSADGTGLEGIGLGEPWLSVAEALRGAPSASNKQPWRLVRLPDGGGWLIFLDEDRVYNNSLGDVHIQNIDIGIGMRHFQEASAELGIKGRWVGLKSSESLPAEAKGLAQALRLGEERGWKPIALWRQ